jgi:hypothetical protein
LSVKKAEVNILLERWIGGSGDDHLPEELRVTLGAEADTVDDPEGVDVDELEMRYVPTT